MTSQTRTLAATIGVGLLLFAALWFIAIGPKHSERAQVKTNVAAQQARLQAAKTQVAAYRASREQFGGLMTELRSLDKAVPSRADISLMLRELQRRAKVRDSDLRLVALKGESSQRTGAASTTTPGAIAGPGGLSALPFTFEYTGRYFDLLDILKTVRRSVRVTSGDLNVDGRLLTIDGLAFKRLSPGKPRTKAIVNATAYIAPDAAAALKPPAGAGQPATTEGS